MFKRERKGLRYDKKMPEFLVLIFFIFILINHLIFPPFGIGIDVFLYFLLIPVLFLKIKRYKYNININELVKVFVSSVLICSILMLIYSSFFGKTKLPINTFFSEPIEMIHVYFGMLVGVASSFILILNLNKDNYISSLIDVFIYIFFTVLLFHIGARISLLGSIFILFVFFLKKLNTSLLVRSLLMIILFSSTIFLGIKTPRFKKGIKQVEDIYTSIINDDKESLIRNSWLNMYRRFLVTKYTIEEIEKNFFLGIGMQNVTTKISSKIKKDGYIHFYPINTHNQYLHFLVGMGVFGLLYFIYLSIFFIKNSYPNSSLFLFFFLLIMLTESILVREKGISVFITFYLIFLSQKQAKHND
ncbi:O-antigen ligase family protein [Tenacibaculum sp. 190524A02b]|uniref:O-antigen ligase family protein n=1 Tax=Tenacibaculum vairaonense TaxID=3137860 RepID=UPI0032B25598